MRVKSLNLKNSSELNQYWSQDSDPSFKPTLAICYSDANFDYKSVVQQLRSRDIEVVGTTTCGEIFDDKNLSGSCSVMLFEIDRSYFDTSISSFEEGEQATANKLASLALSKFDSPAILTYASKIGVNGDRIVDGFKDILPRRTPIFGGLAGDNFKNEKFTVFCNDTFETAGLVCLVFNGEKIKVEGKAFSGWEELGKTHVVNKVEGNVLYEIDNTPALDLFIQYFGVEKAESDGDTPLEVIPGIYPLRVMDGNDEEYMRSPLFYNREDNSLVLAGEIKQGSKVKFCPMPNFETVEATLEYFRSYAAENQNIDALIINTCAARKLSFGPMMDQEIKGIHKLWNVPTAGYMAMGEIGSHTKETECNFHNVTCSLMSLTER